MLKTDDQITLSIEVAELRQEMARMTKRADELGALITELQEETVASVAPKLAYMDAHAAFGVFVVAVSDLRQQITNKDKAINRLKTRYAQRTLPPAKYAQRFCELNAEMLGARMSTAKSTLDRMISSKDFSDLRSEMLLRRRGAQALTHKIKKLIFGIRVGAIGPLEFFTHHEPLSVAFKQFDSYVTSKAATKLVQAAEKVAHQYGYDIILRKRDVIMYRNRATIDDITDLVRAEIQDYL